MCRRDIKYPQKYLFNRAEREKRCCKSCGCKKANEPRRITSFERFCSKCNKHLKYKSYHTWWISKKKNSLCRSCSKKGKTMPKGFSEKISKIVSGSGNPMYRKHHTKKVKDFISKLNRGNQYGRGYKFSKESKQKMREAVVKRVDFFPNHDKICKT